MPALPWSGSGRTRDWLGHLGAVGRGAGALAPAPLWTSGAWATGIGAAVTTLSGLLAERLAPSDSRPGTRPAPAPPNCCAPPAGRNPRLRQVDRPEPAGAHPAETPGAAPAYTERDAAPRLRAALAGGGFALVAGESTAGRTRLAYPRLEWARALIAEGRTDEARALPARVLDAVGRAPEPGHRHLRTARELAAAAAADSGFVVREAEPGPSQPRAGPGRRPRSVRGGPGR
ncbi:hypothetical protein ACFXPW_01500 [Streptomyces goshikiensis]|uniref:hypothetical protein n=1 Tax=Streptomyces goshikiensis TaxID=1942 RepID=UPI003695AA92